MGRIITRFSINKMNTTYAINLLKPVVPLKFQVKKGNEIYVPSQHMCSSIAIVEGCPPLVYKRIWYVLSILSVPNHKKYNVDTSEIIFLNIRKNASEKYEKIK